MSREQLLKALGQAKPTKYKNRKVFHDGMKFDSQGEYKRWLELKLLERAGEICDLQRQITYELIPPVELDGKMSEPVRYKADFVYMDLRTRKVVVEDFKGMKTANYVMKRKMMKFFHGIEVKEVTK